MIDTDKYKGHDTGWKAHFFEDGSIAVGGVCTLFTEETGYITRKMIEANALLIQDAPLLLEEVKRLREGYKKIARDYGFNAIISQGRHRMRPSLDVDTEHGVKVTYHQKACLRIMELFE